MSKKHAGYVFIPVKPETRTALTSLKRGNDTYDVVIWVLLEEARGRIADDYAAQNVDDPRDENG